MLFSCLKESNHSHLPLRYKLRPRSDTNQLSNLVCFSPHSFSYNHTCLNLVVKTPSFTHFRVLDSWTLCPGNTCLPSSLARLPLSVKSDPENCRAAMMDRCGSSTNLIVPQTSCLLTSWTKHVQGLSFFSQMFLEQF